MASAPTIRCEALAVAYRGHLALDAVAGTFAPGSMTAIVGPNGAGKSTLLRTLAGDLAPTRGRVVIEGGTSSSAPPLAFLPQAAAVDRSFPISVADVVLMGLWREIGALQRPDAAQRDRVAAALAAVGLAGSGSRAVGTLSAGQFQRMLFARMMLQDARIILLDEPFAAVDEATTADLLRLVEGWNRDGRTIVAVLHDLAQVRRHFPQTLLLARRPVGWGPTEKVLSPGNVAQVRDALSVWDAPPAASPVRMQAVAS